MIVKRNFSPQKVVTYIWQDLALGAAAAVFVYVAYERFGMTAVALPFGIIGVLGAALAIFLAFRNNASYTRWNEASQLWAAIASYSRVFARLVITFVDGHSHTAHYQAEAAEAFKREMVYRHLAWVNALRLHLRGQPRGDELRPFLKGEEEQALQARQNVPNALLQVQGKRIYDAMATGTLQGFDSFQLEGCLLQFTLQQGACERIKAIPVVRQYDYFTRLFVRLFTLLLPFCLVGTLATTAQGWALLPLTLLIAFFFVTVERVGVVNEAPFENRITDVPLSAICRNIERDLREQLGETNLPPRLEPKDGYLF